MKVQDTIAITVKSSKGASVLELEVVLDLAPDQVLLTVALGEGQALFRDVKRSVAATGGGAIRRRPSNDPTCTEALALAREALEDDRRQRPCRRYDAWGCSVDQDGCAVDPQSCRVCGAARSAHQHDTHDFACAARTREPALARFVVQVLNQTGGLVDDDMRAEYQPERPGCITMGPRVMLPATARAIAGGLLRAADEAEEFEAFLSRPEYQSPTPPDERTETRPIGAADEDAWPVMP